MTISRLTRGMAGVALVAVLGGCGLFGDGDGDSSVDTNGSSTTSPTAASGVGAEGDDSAEVVTTTTLAFLERGFPTELDRIETLDTGNVLTVLCFGRTIRVVGDDEITELKTKLLGDKDVTTDQVADAIDHGCDDADGSPERAVRIFMEDLAIDDAELTSIIDKNCDQFARENNNSVQGIEYDAIVRLALGASDEDLSTAILDVCGPERFTD